MKSFLARAALYTHQNLYSEWYHDRISLSIPLWWKYSSTATISMCFGFRIGFANIDISVELSSIVARDLDTGHLEFAERDNRLSREDARRRRTRKNGIWGTGFDSEVRGPRGPVGRGGVWSSLAL